jgi:hypothetical protein
VKILLEGTIAAGAAFNATLIVALMLPLLAGAVWWAVRHARHARHRNH